MTHPASVYHLGSEFDGFLFASIGEDRTGMRLSVLSALARLDLDPWQEAAELDDMPGKTATERLAARIAALPDALSAHRDSGTIAARLIALLPRLAHPRMPSRKTPSESAAGAVVKSRSIIYLSLIVMTLVLCVQLILAGAQPPAQGSKPHAPASVAAAPSVPISQ